MTDAPLDPRLHPYRPDLAAERLRDRVQAERYASPMRLQVSAGVCPVRIGPEGDAEQLSQALHGEIVEIYEERDGAGWGQMLSDGYVGWFDMEALSAPVLPVTRKVAALRTYVFVEPDVKTAPRFLLSLGARVCETGRREGVFVECARAGWVAERHLAPLDAAEPDAVGVAERFLGAPYQWGGVESLGLDCSGLVQTAWKAAGLAVPRDSRMQRDAGRALPLTDRLDGLARGDVVCWEGHVALMRDPATIIHANAYHMEVAIEALADARDRIAAQYGDVLTVRRLTPA